MGGTSHILPDPTQILVRFGSIPYQIFHKCKLTHPPGWTVKWHQLIHLFGWLFWCFQWWTAVGNFSSFFDSLSNSLTSALCGFGANPSLQQETLQQPFSTPQTGVSSFVCAFSKSKVPRQKSTAPLCQKQFDRLVLRTGQQSVGGLQVSPIMLECVQEGLKNGSGHKFCRRAWTLARRNYQVGSPQGSNFIIWFHSIQVLENLIYLLQHLWLLKEKRKKCSNSGDLGPCPMEAAIEKSVARQSRGRKGKQKS